MGFIADTMGERRKRVRGAPGNGRLAEGLLPDMTSLFPHAGPIALPGRLGRRIDALAAQMMAPPGTTIDFAQPRGEPALASPDSISWRVFKNPVTLFVGGVAAVLLELAEPRVRDGVWDHSTFREDALTRLQRTGLAAMVTVYGARSVAEKLIAGVVRAHGRVTGTTREGQPYQANDPELLLWVQATATYGFVGAYDRFAHALSAAEWDRAVAEAMPSARLYGVVDPPGSRAELEAVFGRFAPLLGGNAVIGEFLAIMHEVEAFPALARPLQRALIKAAIDLLPEGFAARLALDGPEWRLSAAQRRVVRTAARAADRLVLRTAPPARACARLGLAEDWLYRPHGEGGGVGQGRCAGS